MPPVCPRQPGLETRAGMTNNWVRGYVDHVTSHDTHASRLRALVEFTTGSFDTPFPSPFGSSIHEAATGRLVARAYDTVMRDCDVTNHAEVSSIRLANRELGRLSLRGHTLYSTCEPCPMCMSACIWAELDGVVFGASTMDDADAYWPQASTATPDELLLRARFEPKAFLVPHVERGLCQDLFRRCDEVRRAKGLDLPPRR